MSVPVDVWPICLVGLAAFGLVPGFLLRLIVRVYPKSHARRRELVAELYTIDYKERPFFVAQQLELAITEGIAARLRRDRHARSAPSHLRRDEGFRGPTVCSLIGITYRQLDYWARTDLLRPSVTAANQRRYSYRDLLELKLIKRLLDAGISLQSTRQAIECLRTAGSNVASVHLAVDNCQSTLASSEEVVDLLSEARSVISVIPLSGIVSELDDAICELAVAGQAEQST